MQNRDEIKTMSDKILHDKIMKESEYLEELLGPVTYEDPEDFDLDESFQQLLKDREALKAEYEKLDISKSERFIIDDYIIECKGFPTDSWKIKRKLFMNILN